MTVRFAILGAGRIGLVHGQAIHETPGAELVAIADPFPDAVQAAQAKFGGDIRTIDAIEASDDVDAVVICTPTDTHADLIERFARAGKKIFCEKPIDLNVARVRQALATVEAHDGMLMVGFNRRFDPDFCAMKQAIDQGAIGDVEMVTITSRDPGAPPISYIERSGGIFRDMTIHDFDIARWLLGEEPVEVMAVASVLVDPEIGQAGDYDSANVILKTSNGKQCTITNSRRATYGYDQRLEVHGSKGMINVANAQESRVTRAGPDGYHSPPLVNFFLERYMPAYKAEMTQFLAAIETGAPPPASGEDGLRALILAEAAVKSVETGRVVRVDDID